MPTYEYLCDACGHQFEKFQSIMAAPERTCPRCGKRKVRRKIGIGAGVLFKGAGFYETDYRSDGYAKAAEADRKAEQPKPAEAKSTSTDGAATGGAAKSPPTGTGDAPKPAPSTKEPRVNATHPSRVGRGQGNMKRRAAPKGRRKGGVLGKLLLGVAAVVVGLALIGVLAIDVIARTGIQVVGSQVLGVPVTLRGASIGLIGETSSVRGLTVANPKGYTDPDFASLGQASLSARLGELMAETATIRNITIRDLTVTLEKDAQGKLNVDRISENLPDTGGDKPAAPKPDAGPSRVIVVQEFRMESVKVRLRDLVGGKKGVVEATLPDIVLKDVKSDGSVDVLASELSGVVIGSVLQATVSANIEGLSDEVVGGLRNALQNSVRALPAELQGPVETIRGGVGEVLDKAGEGLKQGIGGALDGILGGKKNGR
jgi:putative FmdB family regulatory protein